ncbi:MAG: SDR family NAD(P)-dependent oxidoreductase [Dehalococcoidia bacterium]|jgi:NAD(P)-dependent dehydrogenase (short-subunit alcohol dehydrogenase family)
MLLKDKVAIITGSSRGIGAALALEFAREGASVVVSGATNLAKAEDVAHKVEGLGAKAIVAMADVTDKSQVEAMVSQAVAKFGRIDIVVNNAGNSAFERFREAKEETWDKIYAVHVKGAFYCTKAVIEHMVKQQYGRIINVSSPSALQGGYALSAYATAMGGIISLTKDLAREFARYKITVNCVLPTAHSEMFETFKIIPGFYDRIVSEHLLGIPEPEEIAPLFSFLASDKARFITGQVIHAGGYYIG